MTLATFIERNRPLIDAEIRRRVPRVQITDALCAAYVERSRVFREATRAQGALGQRETDSASSAHRSHKSAAMALKDAKPRTRRSKR